MSAADIQQYSAQLVLVTLGLASQYVKGYNNE